MDSTLGNKSYIYHFGYGYSKKRCKSIATWFINKHLPRHKLMIDIVHRSLMKYDCYGYLDASNYSRPRNFTISLHSKMKEIDYVKTLLHELVHLKQWVEGSLTLKSGRTYYKGKNVSDIKYYEQPHELEAFKLQEELYRQYNRDMCRSSKGKNNFKRLPEFTL